jgi:predicted nucleotidyltransferase component of viral defense system
MSLSLETLRREAGKTGFRPEILEKVDRLLDLLEAMQRHPYLKSRLALKGGTALNLFIFDVPRLSVDIDVNYIGALDRETMFAERQPLERAVEAVASRLGLVLQRAPEAHAGGKWRLRYASVLGQGGTLELDINYMFRTPLWPVARLDSRPVGTRQVHDIPVLDIHELAAGKLAALLARGASRDLFDAHHLLTRHELNQEKLRSAFVLYGAMNRRDWREVSVGDVRIDPRELKNQLMPVLSADQTEGMETLEKWAKRLVDECREALSSVLPITKPEREFLDLMLDRGEIRPDVLGLDADLSERIRSHPALLWKVKNIRG